MNFLASLLIELTILTTALLYILTLFPCTVELWFKQIYNSYYFFKLPLDGPNKQMRMADSCWASHPNLLFDFKKNHLLKLLAKNCRLPNVRLHFCKDCQYYLRLKSLDFYFFLIFVFCAYKMSVVDTHIIYCSYAFLLS